VITAAGEVRDPVKPAEARGSAADTSEANSRRVISSTTWTVGGQLVSIALRLANSLVMTRLLVPQHFALMALMAIFLQGFTMLSDVGIGIGVTASRRGGNPAFLNTAWTIQVARGLLLYLLCLALSAPIAAVYGDSRLAEMLPIVGLSLVISGLASTSILTMNRELRLKGVVMLDVIPQILSIVVMIVWAAISPTVWSLVAGALMAALLRTTLSYRFGSHPHRLKIEPAAARELLTTGRWVIISTGCAFFSMTGDRLILGGMIDKTTFGVYTIAFTLASMPSLLLSRVLFTVAMPAFAARERAGSLMAGYRRAHGAVTLVGGSLTALMVLAGPALVETMYDDRYADAGWMTRLLAVSTWFGVLDVLTNNVQLARLDTKWFAAAGIARVVFVATALPLALTHAGPLAGVCVIALADVPRYAVAVVGAARNGLHVLRTDLRLTFALASTILLGLGVEGAARELPGSLPALLGTIVGVLSWIALRRDDLGRVVAMLHGSRKAMTPAG
jgi:O-antigen/teichoic acid export membrane protein